MLSKGTRLSDLDKEYYLYLQAFIHRAVHIKNARGDKYKYKTIKKLFDLEKEARKIMDEGKEKEPSSLLLKVAEYERKHNG